MILFEAIKFLTQDGRMFYLYSKTLEHVLIKLLEIISLAYVLITQSAHREYSSVNDINDIY